MEERFKLWDGWVVDGDYLIDPGRRSSVNSRTKRLRP